MIKGPVGSYPPIHDYAFIGNCGSAALVSRDGSVDWCCFQRFDASPCFARLLDWRRGGHFRIAPTERSEISRRYLPGTNILETRFRTKSGVLTVTDLMPITRGRGHVEPRPSAQLIRIARCEVGDVQVSIEFEPRFDYGLTRPRLDYSDRVWFVYGGADALTVQFDPAMSPKGTHDFQGKIELQLGEEVRVVLTHCLPHNVRPRGFSPAAIQRKVAETRRFWESWSARCTYRGPYREQVVRSALVLKALTDAETGAIVAAPTTSLPESLGGTRNWDYRYVWLRDAALNLYALFALGYSDEAHRFMKWIKLTTAGRADDLRVLYGVGGERLLQERELAMLDGYRGSRPVRIGNAAVDQFQLDVYGELVDTAWLYHRHGGEIDPEFWAFLEEAVEVVIERWEEPDESFWEFRDARRQFIISKVFCWVAIQRAIRLAQALGKKVDLDRWSRTRDRIRRTIEKRAVDPRTGAFAQCLDSADLDAASLLIPLVRFLPPTDPRVRATVDRVAAELTQDGLVYRYLRSDGLPGDEGAFVICSFWLVDNLALRGDVASAHKLFERLCGYANDVGLLAEQVDVRTGEALGNFPQAFSHVGLIGAALNLEKASAGDFSAAPH